MPYIKKEDREKFAESIEKVLEAFGDDWNCGEFNYFVSSIAMNLFERKKRYQTANDLLGALDGVSKEFYRLQVAPYEDEKLEENGAVEITPKEKRIDELKLDLSNANCELMGAIDRGGDFKEESKKKRRCP